jgi:hypothetical protein
MQGATGYDVYYLLRLLFKWWVIGSSVMWGGVGILYATLRYMNYRVTGH